MKKIHILILMTAVLMLSLPVSAATVLYYDCDTDMAGNPGTPGAKINTGTSPAAGVPDLSGNNYDMWGWANSTQNNSPAFSAETPNDTGLSVDFTGGNLDGYTNNSTINAWSPTTWTIEVAVKFQNVNDWYTMIGRNGATNGGNDADFYLQKNNVNNQFRINFLSVGGTRYILDSGENYVAQPDQWYRIAVTSDGTTLSMYVDDGSGYQFANSMVMTGATPADNALIATNFVWTFGRGWYNGNTNFVPGWQDDIRFSDVVLQTTQFLGADLSAYDGFASPINDDGSVGTLSGSQAQVTLNFKAAKDPNELTGNVLNPAIVDHYIWLSTSAADPNLRDAPIATIPQTSLTNPDVTYELTELLDGGGTYYWMVEEGLNDGTGSAYPPGDPNNIVGPTWSFTTIAATPTIAAGTPHGAVADVNGDASLTVAASASATGFEWYKVVGEQDSAENGETDDILLSDAGIYSGTNTDTLTITGAALADEGQFYCKAYNGLTASAPSRSAYLWTHRLAGYWKFDGNMLDSVADEVAGAPTHDGAIANSGNVNAAAPGDPNYVGDGNGIVGNAMAFFNDDDYVTIPDSDFFNFYPQGMTVNFWYQEKSAAGWRLPLSKLDAGTAGWLFGTDHAARNQVQFIIETGGSAMDGNSAIDLGDGQWHMLTITYTPDDTTLHLYTDGDENAQKVINLSTYGLPSALLSIGGRNTELSIDGNIDEVRLYTYPKTPTEIAQMYTQTTPADDFICVTPTDSEMATYDLNNDCRVNMADFALMAQEWLECQRVPDTACNQ